MDELYLNQTVYYRGHEYVIMAFREIESHEGRSMQIELMEPLYAARTKMDQEARRKHTIEALALLPKMEQVVNEALGE